MSYVDTLSRDARRVVLTQAGMTLLVAVGFGIASGFQSAMAALYGGMTTIAVTVWLARRVRAAGATSTAGAGMSVIYSGMLVRYGVAVLLLGLGLGLFKLAALPLLSAFAVTQFGFLINARRSGSRRDG